VKNTNIITKIREVKIKMTKKINQLKKRVFPDKNYSAVMLNGKTLRFAIDPKKPIKTLDYPEFYDIKITNKCDGKCPYCYQNSLPTGDDHIITERIMKFFDGMNENQKPFQIAYGGGEPTMSRNFTSVMRETYKRGIIPNYTTNGQFVGTSKEKEILETTKKYCGGVAISTHAHLYWQGAIRPLKKTGVKVNLHVIISDKESVDRFLNIYKHWKGTIDHFVLLPFEKMGRASNSKTKIAFKYLADSLKGTEEDIAFGAKFYNFLVKNKKFKVSLYEPESMSSYIDFTLPTPRRYKSSFQLDKWSEIAV
jgi:organic radical activating enzyme